MGRTTNLSHTSIPTNAMPLEAAIQPEQFVTKTHTEWVPGRPGKSKKGMGMGASSPMAMSMEPRQVTVRKDIVQKARTHMDTLKLKHPATMGFRRRRMEEEAKLAGVEHPESAPYDDTDYFSRKHGGNRAPSVPLSCGKPGPRSY